MNEPLRDEPIDDFFKRQFGPDIQPGREARMLDDDPKLAGEINRRLRSEPLPEGVVAPITLALPASLAPIEYVMHVWTYRCTICNTEHKHSEIYGVNHLRSRTGAGAWVRNMSPVARLEWNVPLKVHNLTTRVSAGCFECLDGIREAILPTLPSPPVPQAILKSASEGPAGASTHGKGTTVPKGRPLTTDDFMV